MYSPPSITFLAQNAVMIGALVLGGIIVLFILFFVFQFVGLWVQALVSGAPVRLIDLIMMKFRKVNAREIVYNRISAKKAGIDLPADYLESHFLAGGAGDERGSRDERRRPSQDRPDVGGGHGDRSGGARHPRGGENFRRPKSN